MTTDPVTLTRDQLYELVWHEPTRTIAARYGLSDRGLAKICMRLHVPVPGRGFWAKKAAGKELWRPRLRSLPPTAAPDERQVTVSVEAPRVVTPRPDTAARRQAVLEKHPDRLIQVPSALADPHPLVERTARSLHRARADQRGILQPEAKRVLDIRVTRASVDRALLVCDALIKALEARDFPVTCAEDKRRTSARVLDEDVGVCLEERVRQVEREEPRRSGRKPLNTFLSPYPRYDFVASGELALRITDEDFQSTRRTWRDGKRRRLESLLNRFIVGLVAVAEAKKVERQRREEREKEWERRRREESERQRLRWEEETKVRLLKEDLAAWRSSRDIREYVAAARANAVSRGSSDEERRELDEWLRWVADYADRLDPALRATPGQRRVSIAMHGTPRGGHAPLQGGGVPGKISDPEGRLHYVRGRRPLPLGVTGNTPDSSGT